jgi:GntR family transcriptional regulator
MHIIAADARTHIAMNPIPSVVPLYHQIYLILREEFASRRATELLPTELELVNRFKVSRITLRRAMDKLVKEGLIYRQRGLGSFVKETAAGAAGSSKGGLLENIISMAAKTTIRLLSIETISPPASIAADLELSADGKVVKVIRLRSLGDDPVSYITTYVPDHLSGCLNPDALVSKPMLRLLEEHGVQVAHARQTITARLADTVVASLLQTEVGAPLLAVNRLVRDASGKPVQALYGVYRPDRYEYRMELSRVAEEGEARVWYQNDTNQESKPPSLFSGDKT